MSDESEVIFKTPRFDVVQRKKNEAEFFYIKKPNSALAIVRSKDEKVFLLRTDRVNVSGDCWELPGGRIEANETPDQAIIREVREELSLDIQDVHVSLIGKTMPLPSVTTEIAYIFEVLIGETSSSIVGSRDGMHEGITEVCAFSPSEVCQMLLNGNISCSVDGFALFLFLQRTQ